MHESFEALKPFAMILTEIFANFDCKPPSFTPKSPSFAFLREQLFHLESLLNLVGPGKIHSLLFSVLSRFVTLLSSFQSALSSLSPDDGGIAPTDPDILDGKW
jgi:hypothetical protein